MICRRDWHESTWTERSGGRGGGRAGGLNGGGGGPVGQGVEGTPRQEEVGQQDAQGGGGVQGGLSAGQTRQMPSEQPRQVQAEQEVADQRGGADLEGLEADARQRGRRIHDGLPCE